MAITDTIWCGNTDDKFYTQSGAYTSTIKDSQLTTFVTDTIIGVAWDNYNTPFMDATNVYYMSGQYTTTLKESVDNNLIENTNSDIDFNGVDTNFCGRQGIKLYLMSGHASTTMKESQLVNTVDISPYGIVFDGVNTLWLGLQFDKHFYQSGQYTSTLKDSEDISGVDVTPVGMGWDGSNTFWCGQEGDKLYLTSFRMTSTLKDSEDINAVEAGVIGIASNDFSGKMGLGVSLVYLMEDVVFENVLDVVPSNTVDLSEVSLIFVGVGGDVKVDSAHYGTVIHTNIPSGTFIRDRVKRVYDTGTDATNMIACF